VDREIISERQGISIMVLFLIGSSLVLGVGGEAGKDTWIVVILGILVSLPMVMVYSRIINIFPKKDFFQILEHIFGRVLGKIISLMYIWFAIHLGALVLRNFGEYIITVSLVETPMIIPIIFLLVLCVYVIKNGIEVLGRWGELALIIIISFIVLTVLTLLPEMEIDNLKPVLNKGAQPIIMGVFSIFAFPFAETVLFCIILTNLSKRKSSYRIYFWGLAIGGLTILVVVLRNILVLGETSYITTYFPSHKAVGRTDILDFIQRLEIIISINLLGGGLVKVSVCLFGASKGLASLFGYKDYRALVIPIALIMLNLSYLIYDSIMEMFQWAFKVWPYYAFIFQGVLPIIILIGGEIRVRQNRENSKVKQ